MNDTLRPVQADTHYSWLDPLGVRCDDFSAEESVNTTLADGSVSSAIPYASVSTSKRGIFYSGRQYRLNTPFGQFVGKASATEDTTGLGRFEQHPERVTLISGLQAFNKIRSVPPFLGSLPDYFAMLSTECGYAGRRVVYWDSEREDLLVQGFFGNVYENFTALLTSLGYDMLSVYDCVVLRPWRRLEIDSEKLVDLPVISYANEPEYKFIKTWWYDQHWAAHTSPELCYPVVDKTEIDNPGNVWLPKMAPAAASVLTVDNLGVGTSAYTEQEFDIDAPLFELNQPVCTLPPSVPVAMSDDGTYIGVYRFAGQWQMLGQLSEYIASPDVLTTLPQYQQANAGTLVAVNGGALAGVLYQCMVGFDAATTSFALWYQAGKLIEPVFSSHTSFVAWSEEWDYGGGFYVVTDCNNNPMMPEMWLDNGGRLEVELLKETNKIKVKLWGADIKLDVPVHPTPPIAPGADGDIYGFDISGRMTADTIFYIWKDGAWVYDDTIVPFPYAPYKIAIATDSKDYDGLFITGSGIFYTKRNVVVQSGKYVGSDEEDDEDVTTEIDSRWIVSAAQAIKLAQDFDATANGAQFSMSAGLSVLSESDFVNWRRGSYEAAIDFMMYNGFIGNSFDEASAWWQQFLGKSDVSYDDVSEAILKGTSHNIAFNVFGNVAGSYLNIPNRGMFRITQATITATGISVQGTEDTRFGDLDKMIARIDQDMTFGDLDALAQEIEKLERVGEYSFGMLDQEPGRFRL